jgi:glutamine amidotransferase
MSAAPIAAASRWRTRIRSRAHNGQLKGVKTWPLGAFRPIGTTDSEHAFCWMLERLRGLGSRLPGARRIDAEVARLCAQIAPLGVFNMLLSDGRTLYAYCGKRLCWLTRRAPFGKATLIDEDLSVDFSQVTRPDDIVSVIATRPLTRDEVWVDARPGQLLAWRDGEMR